MYNLVTTIFQYYCSWSSVCQDMHASFDQKILEKSHCDGPACRGCKGSVENDLDIAVLRKLSDRNSSMKFSHGYISETLIPEGPNLINSSPNLSYLIK